MEKSNFPDIPDIEIYKKIHEGGYGEVFIGKDKQNNQELAIKVEKCVLYQRLEHEIKIYQILMKDPNFKDHIPALHFHGEVHFHDYFAMDVMGQNLWQLLKLCGGKFSLKTVLMLADQMLERIEFLHSKGLLHRDIKPDNFVIGRGENKRKIFLIDFGLSDFYQNEDGELVEWKELTYMIGNLKFGSINCQFRHTPFQKDDLESVGFCLCYFLKGSLPWSDLPASALQEIKERKVQIKDVYQGLPEEFEKYARYCRLRYYCQPIDIAFLRSLFKECMIKNGFEYDYIFDWEPLLKEEDKLDLGGLEEKKEEEGNFLADEVENKFGNSKEEEGNLKAEIEEENKGENSKENRLE